MIISTVKYENIPLDEKFEIKVPWGASIKAFKYEIVLSYSDMVNAGYSDRINPYNGILELILVKNPNRDSVKKRSFIIYSGKEDFILDDCNVNYKCSFGDNRYLFEFK